MELAKRPYQRSRGILRDEYTNPEGRRHVEEVPASFLGEPLSDADREQGLVDVVSGDSGAQFRGIHSLAGDHSPEYLERLLASLENGSAAAPNALLQFVEDPRVRPALAAAARRAPANELANFAQAVALAGGEGAVAVLRECLQQLNTDEAFADDPFFNPVTGSLVTVASGLLRLGSDQQEAATVLAAVVRKHPCAFNRRSAAYHIGEALEDALPADTRRTLEGVLVEQLASDDPEMLAAVAPALAKAKPDRVFPRCGELLGDPSSEIRFGVTLALQKMRDPKARALLLEHLPREPWVRSAVRIAAYLGGDVPAALRADIAKRALADESPSLRRGAAALLRDLDPDTARGLAETAMADEPDPLLRKRLQEHLGRAST
jgi:hypothetical protein